MGPLDMGPPGGTLVPGEGEGSEIKQNQVEMTVRRAY